MNDDKSEISAHFHLAYKCLSRIMQISSILNSDLGTCTGRLLYTTDICLFHMQSSRVDRTCGQVLVFYSD